MVKVFEDIKEVFRSEYLSKSIFGFTEEKKAQKIYENRKRDSFVTNYHYLAFYLDPRYREMKIIESDEGLISIVYQTLNSYAVYLGIINSAEDSEELAESLDAFRTSSKVYGIPLLIGRSPSKYWKHLKSFSSSSKLATIAHKLLSIPASSAGVERSFSTQKRTHTSERNRLTSVKVEKIMRIHWSLNQKIKEEKALKETLEFKVSNSINETEFDLNEVIVLEDPYTDEQLNTYDEPVRPQGSPVLS